MQQAPAPTPGPRSIRSGMRVEAVDGHAGTLAAIVIDRRERRMTHLVVKPHRHESRLVEIDAVTSAEPHLGIRLTIAELLDLPPVEHTDVIELGEWPHAADGWDIGVIRVVTLPEGTSTTAMAFRPWIDHDHPFDVLRVVTYDRIPFDSAEIERSSDVISSDGHVVGRVGGFVLDTDDRVTHVLLEAGHLWGHHEVAVPVAEVSTVETGAVAVRLDRAEVAALAGAQTVQHHSR